MEWRADQLGLTTPVVSDEARVELCLPDVDDLVPGHSLEWLRLMVTLWEGNGRGGGWRRRRKAPGQGRRQPACRRHLEQGISQNLQPKSVQIIAIPSC